MLTSCFECTCNWQSRRKQKGEARDGHGCSGIKRLAAALGIKFELGLYLPDCLQLLAWICSTSVLSQCMQAADTQLMSALVLTTAGSAAWVQGVAAPGVSSKCMHC